MLGECDVVLLLALGVQWCVRTFAVHGHVLVVQDVVVAGAIARAVSRHGVHVETTDQCGEYDGFHCVRIYFFCA